ncbi:MAG: amidohydrolase family protein [Acidimicrobiales bacterium]
MPKPILVDSHVHLYSADEDRYRPSAGCLRPPSGTGSLERLRHLCRKTGVSRVCAIQTATFYGFDNRYVCDVSKANPDWIAGICMIDPENPDGPQLLKELVLEHGVRGLRSRPSADGQLDRASVRRLWAAAADLGIVVNILASRENADGVDNLLREFPTVPAVLEHSLCLNLSTDRVATLRELARLSRHENVNVELCDLPVLSCERYPFPDMHNTYLKIIDMYGPERSLWGSCFPLELWMPEITYGEHQRIFQQEIAIDAQARAAILGETANRLWFRGIKEQSSGIGQEDGDVSRSD